MNKKDLIDVVSKNTGLMKKEAKCFVEGAISVITNTLSKGEKVCLTGFGIFTALEKNAKKGINPQTKAIITIPARRVPKFKAGKALKKAMEGN